MTKQLLRIPNVARILDVTEDSVYRMAREGVIPHVRVGRQIRFDEEQLERWISSGGKGSWRKELVKAN